MKETYKHIDSHFSVNVIHVNITVDSVLVIKYRKRAISTYNSSRQRIGEPMASQRANRRQTCENDFSPPDSVLAPRPVLLSFVISGSTYGTVRLCGDIERAYIIAYLKIKKFTLMVSQETTSEASFAQKVCKLGLRAR